MYPCITIDTYHTVVFLIEDLTTSINRMIATEPDRKHDIEQLIISRDNLRRYRDVIENILKA